MYVILSEIVIKNVSIRLKVFDGDCLIALFTSAHMYEQPDVPQGYDSSYATVLDQEVVVIPFRNSAGDQLAQSLKSLD